MIMKFIKIIHCKHDIKIHGIISIMQYILALSLDRLFDNYLRGISWSYEELNSLVF